jgi:excisionase family DNA binding protein
MTLADWIWSEKITRTEAARRLGLSQSYVVELCQGKRLPSLRVAEKIRHETNGKVCADDFFARSVNA